MRRIIHFSRVFLFFMIVSLIAILSGFAGYKMRGGFNMGIDFSSGLIQEVQLVPRAFSLSYDGPGNAVITLSGTSLSITVSGVGVQGFSYQYLLSDYGTVSAFAQALDQIEGVTAHSAVSGSVGFNQLVINAESVPVLPASDVSEDKFYWVHYLPVYSAPVPLDEMRTALASIGAPAIQVLGEETERRFLIRLQDSDIGEGFVASDIGKALEARFGEGEAVVASSNYVGSRFSQNLANQAVVLLGATLLLVLLYASIRFKPLFAIAAVLGIIHNALIVVGFIAWTGMEFNTTTIAAIMTVLGYSTNDTIVVFDRIRETTKLYPDDGFELILNRAITETLTRTFITTFSTLLAVISLYIFTTGAMKDFALAIIVGFFAGPYSTIFIACGFLFYFKKRTTENTGLTPA